MTLDEQDRSAGASRLTSLPGDEYPRQWARDGSTITFDSVVNDAWDVMTIHPDGTDMVALTHDGVSTGGAWSPDGTCSHTRTLLPQARRSASGRCNLTGPSGTW
jgi:hypothetical protein